jgi:hypothetical protein
MLAHLLHQRKESRAPAKGPGSLFGGFIESDRMKNIEIITDAAERIVSPLR